MIAIQNRQLPPNTLATTAAMSTVANSFQPLERRARLAIICFWAFMAAAALLAISLIAVVSLDQNLYADADLQPQGALEIIALLSAALTAILYLVLFLVCIVVFLMWLYRARRNLTALGITAVRWSPGWAIAWWFIPIMSLFRPYQVVKETWEASDPTAAPSERLAANSSAYLSWWWGLFLVFTIGNRASDRYATVSDPADLTTAATLTVIDVAILITGIGAAWLAIRFMREITLRQRQRQQLGAFA